MSDGVTGKLTRMPVDIDWQVEQKLARVLAERDLYWDGFWHGMLMTAIVIGIVVAAFFREWIEI